MLHEKQSSVEVHVSIQSSGKPIERFLVDDQFEFRHFILYISSRIYENRTIGHQEPTHLKLTQLK